MQFNVDDINELSSQEQDYLFSLLEDLDRIHCEESYYHFFKRAWKVIEPATPLNDSPHIKLMCDTLQRQVMRQVNGEPVEYDTMVFNVPPSCSKSSVVTKIFPAWVWILLPASKIINTSYSGKLALDHSSKTRDLIQSDWFKKRWSDVFKLRADQNAKGNYENSSGGVRFATSTKGSLTGFHCHILISDDPVNPKQADSDAERKSASDFWEKTVPSRMLENSFKILVMQRLHVEDPTGIELANKESNIHHVCLPAELADNVRPLSARDIYQDGLLDPKRLPASRLKKFLEALGSYDYSGQYSQEPIPKDGGVIEDGWFRRVPAVQVPTNLIWDMWIDGAYTKSSKNDPTGIMVCGFDKMEKMLYIKFFKGEYLEMPALLRKIAEYCDLFNLTNKSRIYIEPKASGKSLVQMLNQNYRTITAVEIKSHLVSEGKNARIQVAAPKFEAGRIVEVKDNWNSEFEMQLTGFPNVTHDEAVDLIGYAANKYYHAPVYTGD